MTDPDSILQLGIEAARDGNKEEARDLFRLLTSEDPNNVQGWLWLAGVAESLPERRTALERTLELDPNNDMARKSMQALEKEESAAQPATPADEPARSAAASAYDSGDDFDDPFAELDALSEVMEEDSKNRADTPQPSSQVKPVPTPDYTPTPTTQATETTKKPGTSPSGSWSSSTKDKGREKPMSKKPASSGINLRAVALVLALIVVVMGLIFVVKPMFFDKPQQATQPSAPPASSDQQPAAADQQPAADQGADTGAGSDTGAASPDDAGTQPADDATGADQPTATPETPKPAPPSGPPEAPADNAPVSIANVTIVPSNTPQELNNWLYDYNENICNPNACATIWPTSIRSFTPKGRFIIVLTMVANRTGTTQALPADFLVLKDSQGRVYNALPQVAEAYVTPGVNADLSHANAIPANGIATSIAVVFDVDVGATDLVLVAPGKPDQGWKILDTVR